MTKIDGKTPDSVPARVKAAMKRGVPKQTAMSAGMKPKSTVKV